MARLRKFAAYRCLERPYTRKSKYKQLSYIKANPAISIVRFDMGDANKVFPYRLCLVSKDAIQIRHNAIEAGRQSSNKMLEAKLGKTGYAMKIMVYPHHILRENPLASGAGADRMSQGMQLPFGKPISAAAQIRTGQTLVRLDINKQNLDLGRMALKRFARKLPCSTTIVQMRNAAAA